MERKENWTVEKWYKIMSRGWFSHIHNYRYSSWLFTIAQRGIKVDMDIRCVHTVPIWHQLLYVAKKMLTVELSGQGSQVLKDRKTDIHIEEDIEDHAHVCQVMLLLNKMFVYYFQKRLPLHCKAVLLVFHLSLQLLLLNRCNSLVSWLKKAESCRSVEAV